MHSFDSPAFATLREVCENPIAYAEDWKRRTGGKVVGSLPMNFPSELIHATGALPVVIQESRTPITEGRNLLAEFYCGFTRSVADQAAVGELDHLDALMVADHCVQLLGAVDVIRWAMPRLPNHFAQFITSYDEPWSPAQVRAKVESLHDELENVTGVRASAESLAQSIALFNRNRQLLRHVYELRRRGPATIRSADIQVLIKSSMIMDVAEHTDLLERLVADIGGSPADPDTVRLHLSGHFCHAPRPALLGLIEECGAIVVNDDLYTGFRYISTDVPEDDDPIGALAHWYLERNATVPCATRVQTDVNWDEYLISAVRDAQAHGVVVLLPKFCEPHMLYYPEVRKALDENGIPHLLIETEHEGLPVESLRTRIETFLERIRRHASAVAASV